MTTIIPIASKTDRLEDDEQIKLGQWYWLKVSERLESVDGDDYDEDEDEDDDNEKPKTKRPKKPKTKIVERLCCVMHVGSNYAELKSVEPTGYSNSEGPSWRVHFNEWADLCTYEPDPTPHIRRKIDHHQDNVRGLLEEIQRVTVSLGIIERRAIGGPDLDTSTQALAAASGEVDIKAHKQALIKAKKETLPDLFKQVEKQHEYMASWMKAETYPAKAEFGLMKQSIESIDDRIFTVELYAGLCEKLEQIRDGKPADNDTKVSLFQRRHYMDEECLANYEAGGMDYRKIADFDRWLTKPENFTRLLPFQRSIISFRVRRFKKDREGFDLSDWLRILDEEKFDKQTFLPGNAPKRSSTTSELIVRGDVAGVAATTSRRTEIRVLGLSPKLCRSAATAADREVSLSELEALCQRVHAWGLQDLLC